MTQQAPSQRDSMHLENAEILSHSRHLGDQFVMELAAPQCAQTAKAGQFVHLTCAPQLPLRRPLSLLDANPNTGRIQLLYKVVGEGTRLLSQRTIGETLSLLGPIGQSFEVNGQRPLLLGGGIGMPPMIFLAKTLRKQGINPLVLLASEVPFPFTPQPSRMMLEGIPAETIAAMPLLEDLSIPSRLATWKGFETAFKHKFAGCFDGLVTDLARTWLSTLDSTTLSEVSIFACGPEIMLQACVDLARQFALPCQISMEEFMACGTGGCAGCVIPLQTESGQTVMQRVCVDGPVFDGYAVFPQTNAA